jgi:GGDEF domain-containing protein
MMGGALGVTAAVVGSHFLALTAGFAAFGAAAAIVVLGRHARDATGALTGTVRARDDAEVRAAASAARAEAMTQSLQEAEAALADAELSGDRRGPESVFDTETGLLDERVFVVAFERKVAAARRHLRPLCLVLLDLDAGLPAEEHERSQALMRFGATVRQTLRDADVACRIGSSAFGLILEDTPEGGGVWAAERLQIAVACAGGPPTRVAAAVATPIHRKWRKARRALARGGR